MSAHIQISLQNQISDITLPTSFSWHVPTLNRAALMNYSVHLQTQPNSHSSFLSSPDSSWFIWLIIGLIKIVEMLVNNPVGGDTVNTVLNSYCQNRLMMMEYVAFLCGHCNCMYIVCILSKTYMQYAVSYIVWYSKAQSSLSTAELFPQHSFGLVFPLNLNECSIEKRQHEF